MFHKFAFLLNPFKVLGQEGVAIVEPTLTDGLHNFSFRNLKCMYTHNKVNALKQWLKCIHLVLCEHGIECPDISGSYCKINCFADDRALKV